MVKFILEWKTFFEMCFCSSLTALHEAAQISHKIVCIWLLTGVHVGGTS
jgi:hypothetical protein